MPPNPDMSTVMSQMAQMQAAQASSANMLASSLGSIQQTIAQMAQATQMGVQTAYHGGAGALQALQLGAATALGDVAAIGGAIGGGLQALSGPPGMAPGIGMAGVSGGGGMSAGGTAFGMGVGTMALLGAAGGIAAWEGTAIAMGAGFRGVTGAGRGFMAATRMGAQIGARTIGGGAARMALGGLIGGGMTAAAAIAVPLAASIAIEEAVSTGIEHMTAVRDVEAVLTQQSGRILAFDPTVDMPRARDSRTLASSIVSDLSSIKGFGPGSAAQFVSQAGELGLFSGAGGDQGSIRAKAKELAESVKEMTALLGTSMEEGLTMLAELKQTGITGDAAPGAILASRGRGRLGGFTGAEMHAVGMRGAQMFRGTGFGPAMGFNAAQNNLAQVSDMVQRGVINNDLVAAMGGRQAMGEAMTQSQVAFMQGGAGRAFIAAGAQGRGGAMAVISGRDTFAGAAMRGIDAGDPTQLAVFLGSQGQVAQDLGPEMIAAAQQAALLRLATGAGVELGDLSTKRQIQALAGIAATPAGQQMLGIRGLDQATLLATQTINAPEAMTRQVQAMRSEAWRESMLRYNQQNIGFGGVWNDVTTFGRAAGRQIGRPFVAARNAMADAYDSIGESVGDYWNEERTEILPKASIEVLNRAEAGRINESLKHPEQQEQEMSRILDPESMARVKKQAESVTLSGSLSQISEQARVGGYTLLGSEKETFGSRFLSPGTGQGGMFRGKAGEPVFTIEAVRTTEAEAISGGATTLQKAFMQKGQLTAAQRDEDRALFNKNAESWLELTPQEMTQLGMSRLNRVGRTHITSVRRYGGGKGEARQLGTRAVAFMHDKSNPKEARMEIQRKYFLQRAGGDKEAAARMEVRMGASDLVDERRRAIDFESGAELLQSEEESLRISLRGGMDKLSETLLGESDDKTYKFMRRNMDLIAKLVGSRDSKFDADIAAVELSERAEAAGLQEEVNVGRILRGIQQVDPTSFGILQERATTLDLSTRAKRRREVLQASSEDLVAQIEKVEKPGQDELKAVTIATRIGGARGPNDIVRIVASYNKTDDDRRSLDVIAQKGGVLAEFVRTTRARLDAGEDITAADVDILSGGKGLAGERRVKTDREEQARVEAFASESLKGFKNMNQTTEHLLVISQGMMAEMRRMGIGTSNK